MCEICCQCSTCCKNQVQIFCLHMKHLIVLLNLFILKLSRIMEEENQKIKARRDKLSSILRLTLIEAIHLLKSNLVHKEILIYVTMSRWALNWKWWCKSNCNIEVLAYGIVLSGKFAVDVGNRILDSFQQSFCWI